MGGEVYAAHLASAQANNPANSDSVAGWIFDDMAYSLALAAPGCRYSADNFEHVFSIILNVPTVGWAGIAFQPGNQLIVQVGGEGGHRGARTCTACWRFHEIARVPGHLVSCTPAPPAQGGYDDPVSFHEYGHNLGLQVCAGNGGGLGQHGWWHVPCWLACATCLAATPVAALQPVGRELADQHRVRRRHVHHGRRERR